MLKVLLPTDFSEIAWNAICYALEFLEDQVCSFHLLHTYTPAFYRMDYLVGGPSFSAIPDTGIDVSIAGLEKTMADIQAKYANPNHEFQTVSAFNLLTDEINRLAWEKNIDMVIMGTKGATGAAEIFLGTNTVYVMRKAKIPVMIIPENAKFAPLKKILFPTDYWTRYNNEELDFLVDTAKICKCEVTVLHVKEEYDLSDNQQDNKEHLAKCLADIPHHFEELKGALMPDAVMNYVDDHKFEFLVMMNRKHSFLERMLWKQNIDQIGFQVQVPFLVIPDTARVTK